MKSLMSGAIAVALTLLVVSAMVNVSAGAQEATGLAENLRQLSDAVQNADVEAIELEVEAQLVPSGPDDPVPSPEVTIRCRDRGDCARLADALEPLGWTCQVNIFGTTVCRSP